MTYYLLLSGDTEKDSIFETNVLGEESFETFYPSIGFMILQRILNDKPEIVETIKILDDKKNPYTIEEFVNKLEKWKIKSACLVHFFVVYLTWEITNAYFKRLGRLC